MSTGIGVTGTLSMEYAWNKGRAGSLFLDHLAHGRIVGSRCANCQIISVPPRSFCGRCLKRTRMSVKVAQQGRVESWTRDERSGRTYVLVRLNRTNTGILHLFVGAGLPKPGMTVRPVWNSSRSGEITDLAGFCPSATNRKKRK